MRWLLPAATFESGGAIAIEVRFGAVAFCCAERNRGDTNMSSPQPAASTMKHRAINAAGMRTLNERWNKMFDLGTRLSGRGYADSRCVAFREMPLNAVKLEKSRRAE